VTRHSTILSTPHCLFIGIKKLCSQVARPRDRNFAKLGNALFSLYDLVGIERKTTMCGRGGIGRRAALRSLFFNRSGSSSLLGRTKFSVQVTVIPSIFIFGGNRLVTHSVHNLPLWHLLLQSPCAISRSRSIWFVYQASVV
jgi:hypothetical protein